MYPAEIMELSGSGGPVFRHLGGSRFSAETSATDGSLLASMPLPRYASAMGPWVELLARTFFFVFGVITVGGGVMGYVKAQSKASLIAGGLGGFLLIVGAAVIGFTTSRLGVAPVLAVSLALAGRFVPAYWETRKQMPQGLMAGLSTAGILLAAGTIYVR
jgi:uncharacterized membrane protein (UPF0136 family)